MSELGREKAELEIRAEEAQDECEDLLGSQRSHMAQISSLQSQLNEANMQVDDLQDSKQSLEKKVGVGVLMYGTYENQWTVGW